MIVTEKIPLFETIKNGEIKMGDGGNNINSNQETNNGYILNYNKISTSNIKDLLINAENFYLENTSELRKSSSSNFVITYAKAVEYILHDKISISFKPYLMEKYENKYIHNKSIRIKFEKLQEDKIIPLKIWQWIILDFNNELVDENLKPFKLRFNRVADEATSNAIFKICDLIIPLVNPTFQINALTIKEKISIRNNIVELINQIINKLY